MTDGPYDYARERLDAENASHLGTRRIAGEPRDEADVPDEDEL